MKLYISASSQRVFMLLVILCLTFAYMVHSSSTTQCNSITIQSHVDDLDREIGELTCIQTRLSSAIYALNRNATMNSQILKSRQRQFDKISNAISLLVQESSFLKNVTIVSSAQGFIFGDGSRAPSCRQYRYPANQYRYENQGSGLYVIEPSPNLTMVVYCDMTTDGGGWTLISGIRSGYQGIHFHTFEDSSAVETSLSTSFHIKTKDLLANATQIRAASDSSVSVINSFYRSEWPFSAACQITSELRNAIDNSTFNNGDLPTNCVILSGLQVTPTHFTYGRTCNDHSTGFRLGYPLADCVGHLNQTSYATYSFDGALEGQSGKNNGINWSFNGESDRNGAVYLR